MYIRGKDEVEKNVSAEHFWRGTLYVPYVHLCAVFRFEFKEFVDIAVQTDADKEKENLQDTVTAYEMQNKFLNKEVLELNQLRTQAADKEQKLFM